MQCEDDGVRHLRNSCRKRSVPWKRPCGPHIQKSRGTRSLGEGRRNPQRLPRMNHRTAHTQRPPSPSDHPSPTAQPGRHGAAATQLPPMALGPRSLRAEKGQDLGGPGCRQSPQPTGLGGRGKPCASANIESRVPGPRPPGLRLRVRPWGPQAHSLTVSRCPAP